MSKYTYEDFISAARECENKRTSFIRKHRRLYEFSRTVGWYDSYKWNQHSDNGKNNYKVYAIKDDENKVVYIGLTKDLKNRKNGHKYSGVVHDYFGSVFTMDVLDENLSSCEAKRLEDYHKTQFFESGWRILNKAKTGERSSSLGGGYEELTYEICFNKARKFKTKTAFQKGDVSAYRKALENGWLDKWFSNVDTEKWTRFTSYEEAKKYKTKMEFRRGNQFLYEKARKNKWLQDYKWMRRENKWDYNTCYSAAKGCTSKTDFAKKHSSAYRVATKNGWINHYSWFKNSSELLGEKNTKWTFESSQELAKKYKTRCEFGKENSGAYHACLKNKWLDSFDWLVNKRPKWTYERCKSLAKKYKTRWEFGKENGGAYAAARKNGWLDVFFPIDTEKLVD